MIRQFANDTCAALPGATLQHPFGPETDTWKTGGKIFALVAVEGVSLKCPDADTAAMLIDVGVAVPAPYLKRGGWVRINWSSVEAGGMSRDDLAGRLEQSHEAIVQSLPKRLRP